MDQLEQTIAKRYTNEEIYLKADNKFPVELYYQEWLEIIHFIHTYLQKNSMAMSTLKSIIKQLDESERAN